jgi:hypothetical protein
MPTLNISEFSCLKEATIEVAPVNVIIGPQGTGKSVTTKLLYFFSDILINFVQSAERGENIADYRKFIARQFQVWFPPSAWGQCRFNLNYSAGAFSVRILRRKSRGQLADEVSVTFADWFTNLYNETAALFERSRSSNDDDIAENQQVRDDFEKIWRVRELTQRNISRGIGDTFFNSQTFIPAGRAFFTSIGRIVAGFEQAGSLDPITIKFARLFANMRDRQFQRSRIYQTGDDYKKKRLEIMGKLFGGEIKFENEKEFVETSDGRKIPFSMLSSGQQELLPIWAFMDYFNQIDSRRSTAESRRLISLARQIIYIEEPEAHLFPSAQSLFMEFLISSIVSEKRARSLIITTHSPYIMSKLNVFLKAGQLAKRKKKNQEINEVVQRECWLYEKDVSAFAIEDGKLYNILGDDGLIDGCYLDAISEEISIQYSQLLNIESEM